ncbi:phosphate/phosphite/phosphonate ABC transporter substrate-binding protein [Parasalinivibrio latis]|uniref:phosphate/phosphite/phosphonate ABC transporter substrate-binding protein n=1 Tax=Parasalinivibrio latis TaxID=2952610 RepID=UPI0030DEE628
MKHILLLVIFLFPINSFAQDLVFGIVPQQSASKLARNWSPLLSQLSALTGYNIRFATAPNIPTFEKRLAGGEYDIAYMNPYHYVVFSSEPGYAAINKAKNKLLKGIIVVKKDGPINDESDLNGHTLAFPSPAAFAASILTRDHLTQEGVDFKPRYVSSHDSVYISVAKGLMPAGGGVKRTLGKTSPEIREQLRVLWTTKGYTPHAIAVHPRVTPEVSTNIQKAIALLDSYPEGTDLLESIGIKGFENASNSDWDDVRELDINLLLSKDKE